MERTKHYQDLLVWQKAIELTEHIYIATKVFPKEEVYGLTSQMRRSAVSIASNIAEGQARNSTQQFITFSSYSKGSTAELDTQLIIAYKLKFLSPDEFNSIKNSLNEVSKMLSGLIKAIAKN